MPKVIKGYITFFDNETGRFVKYFACEIAKEEHMKYLTSPNCFVEDTPEPAEAPPQLSEKELREKELQEMEYKDLLQMAKDQNISFDKNPKKIEVIEALLSTGEDDGE